MTQPALAASSASLLIASCIAGGTSNGASLCFTMVMNRMGISPLFDQLVSTGDLLAQLAVMLDGWAFAEIVQLEHRPDLDLAVPVVRIGAAFDPFDRVGERAALQDPIAGHQLLGLRERAVDHGALVTGFAELAAVKSYPRALGTRLESVAVQHHASLDHLLVELRHGSERLLGWHHAGFGVLGRLNENHEPHSSSPSSHVSFQPEPLGHDKRSELLGSIVTTNEASRYRHGRKNFFGRTAEAKNGSPGGASGKCRLAQSS